MAELQTWIPLGITLVTLAATWGDVRARLNAVEKLAEKTATDLETKLDKSRRDQGGRIGELKESVDTIKGALGLHDAPRARRNSRAIALPPPPAEDDESGASE